MSSIARGLFGARGPIIESVKRGFKTAFDSSTGRAVPNGPILFIPGMAALAGGLVSARNKKLELKFNPIPELVVAHQRSWFEQAHPEHHANEWGYGIYDYPVAIRELMAEAGIKSHSRSDSGKLLWSDVIRLKTHILDRLHTEFGARIIEGTVDIPNIKLDDKGLFVPISGTHLERKDVMMPSETDVYLAGIGKPRVPFPGCPTTLDLFAMDPKDTPQTMVLYGAGLSAAWVVKFFPKIKFVVLKRAEDRLLSTSETGEWWKRPNMLGVVNIDGPNQATVLPYGDYKVYIKSDDLPGGEVIGSMCAAMGMSPRGNLPSCIPREHQVIQVSIPAERVIAPRILQPGSFMHSLYEYMQTTSNPHHLGMTTTEDFTNYIREHVAKHGLEISEVVMQAFTTEFAEQIRILDHNPDHEEVTAIIKASYEACEPDPSKRAMFANATKMLEASYIHGKENSAQAYRGTLAGMREEGAVDEIPSGDVKPKPTTTT